MVPVTRQGREEEALRWVPRERTGQAGQQGAVVGSEVWAAPASPSSADNCSIPTTRSSRLFPLTRNTHQDSSPNTVGDTISMQVEPWFSHEVGKDFLKWENGGESLLSYVG